MSDKIEKLKKLRAQLRKYNDTLSYYQRLFEADHEIDEWEAKQLEELRIKIATIQAKIDKDLQGLTPVEVMKNAYSTTKESILDQMSDEDDVIDNMCSSS